MLTGVLPEFDAGVCVGELFGDGEDPAVPNRLTPGLEEPPLLGELLGGLLGE